MKNNELNKIQKQNKLLKGFVIGLSVLSAIGVTASIAAPLVVLSKNKGGDSKTTTYNVTFKDGDTTILTQKVVENEKTTKPQDPAKEDYSFVGWYDNEGCEGDPFNFDTPITKAITLYAKWTYDFAPELPNYKSATTLFAVEQSTIKIVSVCENKNMKYSRTGDSWDDVEVDKMISIPKGGCLYLIGDNPEGLSIDDGNYWNINVTGKCNIGGSAMGLLYNGAAPTDDQQKTIPNNYCFCGLFSDSSGLRKVSANFLPATTLTENCYASMFYHCSSLECAPKLPASILKDSCYNSMFNDCYSLINAPALPATTLAEGCYASMFNCCYLLENAPELPANELKQSCYGSMFNDCHSLKNAPELPATTLASYCYENMFSNCMNLINAPALNCKNLVNNCYDNMFSYCSSLTSLPELPATELTTMCYNQMFKGCSSVKIKEITEGQQAPTTGKIFACPTGVAVESYINEMFCETSGTFYTEENYGTPAAGNSYYWYTE